MSVTEGKQRSVAGVKIEARASGGRLTGFKLDIVDQSHAFGRTACILSCVIKRHLSHHTRQANRQVAARIDLAGEDIGNRGTAHCTRVKQIDHGVGQLGLLGDCHRTSGHQHTYHRLPGGFESAKHLCLSARQRDVGTAMRLTRQYGFLTSEEKYDIGFRCLGDGLCNSLGITLAAVCKSRSSYDILFAIHLRERLKRSYGMLFLKVEHPCSVLVMFGVHHRTCYGDFLHIPAKRQHTVVFQKHGRLLGRTPCGIEIRCSIETAGIVHVDIRVLKQAKTEFRTQDIANKSVEGLDRHLSLFYKFFQVSGVCIALHIHVYAGIGRLSCSVAEIFAVSVGNHLLYRAPVADHQTVPAPLAAQYIAQKVGIARRRHAVDIVERAHERGRSGFCRSLERRKIDIAQIRFRNPCGVIVAASFCCAIACKMLYTRSHRIGFREIIALISLYHSHTET